MASATRAKTPPGPTSTTKPQARPERARTAAASVEPGAPTAWWRRDGVVATACAVLSAAAFGTTFSTNPAFGDSTESILGTRALGILHAPGYPTYVLFARLFATVFAIGSYAARVNLFSLVCASASIAVCYLVARRFGAGKTAAATASLALALTATFWFNAGFAKHYAFTMLLLSGAVLCAAIAAERRTTASLVVGAVLLGLLFGAGWQQLVVVVVPIVILVAASPNRPSLRSTAIAIGSFVAAGLAVTVYVLVRAGQHPAVNWGNATTLGRFVTLITQRDFRNGAGSLGATSNAGLGHKLLEFGGMAVRDVSVLVVVLALVGFVWAFVRLRLHQSLFLVTLLVVNFVVAALAAGPDHLLGFQTGLTEMGYLLGALLAVVVATALGIDAVIEGVTALWARAFTSGRRVVPALTAAVLALALLVPSFVVHRSLAQHRGPDLVDRLARAVLAPLPNNALLMVWGAEYATPLQYAQRFHGVRPDVTVFSGDQVLEPWYVDNLVRELDVPRSVFAHKQNGTRIIDLFNVERTRRPVYLDTTAMANVFTGIGYNARGLVGEVVDGRGPQPITSAAQLPAFANGTSSDIEHGANRGFPNDRYSYFYERAHIELAKSLAKGKAYGDAAGQLRLAAAVGRGSDQAYLTTLATALDSGSNLDTALPALEQY